MRNFSVKDLMITLPSFQAKKDFEHEIYAGYANDVAECDKPSTAPDAPAQPAPCSPSTCDVTTAPVSRSINGTQLLAELKDALNKMQAKEK